MNLLAALVLTVASIVLLAILVIAEIDRNSRPHRFGIALRSSHLAQRRGRWRWYLHPLFTPDAIDRIVGEGRPALAGWARTYPGAYLTATRARRRLEAAFKADRRRFVAMLHDRGIDQADLSAGNQGLA